MEYLLASATTELVVVGVIIAVMVMGWMFSSGFIDEWGPLIGLALALTVGTVLPAVYIILSVPGL